MAFSTRGSYRLISGRTGVHHAPLINCLSGDEPGSVYRGETTAVVVSLVNQNKEI